MSTLTRFLSTSTDRFDSTEWQKSNNIKSHDLLVHTYSTFLQLILCGQWKSAQKTEKIALINRIVSFLPFTFTLHLICFYKSLIISLLKTNNKPDATLIYKNSHKNKTNFLVKNCDLVKSINKQWITIYSLLVIVDKNYFEVSR